MTAMKPERELSPRATTLLLNYGLAAAGGSDALPEVYAELKTFVAALLSENERLRATALTPEEASQLIWKWVDWTGPNRWNAALYESAITKLRRSLSGETK